MVPHSTAIYAANDVDHVKGVSWFSFSMHACGSVPIVGCSASGCGAPLSTVVTRPSPSYWNQHCRDCFAFVLPFFSRWLFRLG